jgi:hypothetical protein
MHNVFHRLSATFLPSMLMQFESALTNIELVSMAYTLHYSMCLVGSGQRGWHDTVGEQEIVGCLVLDDGRAVGQRDSLFHKLFHS